MHINADFTLPASVRPENHQWIASPQAGVERVMLDRVGAEVARATSLVRYAPGSDFRAHRHAGGEEILVLSGVFSDEHGDYPAGWYLRNPPGSSHSPRSAPGAVIFVKLQQMRADETQTVRIDTRDAARWQAADGRAVCRLFDDAHEQVSMLRLPGAAPLTVPERDGMELLVISGALSVDGIPHPAGSWIRLPPGAHPAMQALEDTQVYAKTGPGLWPADGAAAEGRTP